MHSLLAEIPAKSLVYIANAEKRDFTMNVFLRLSDLDCKIIQDGCLGNNWNNVVNHKVRPLLTKLKGDFPLFGNKKNKFAEQIIIKVENNLVKIR